MSLNLGRHEARAHLFVALCDRGILRRVAILSEDSPSFGGRLHFFGPGWTASGASFEDAIGELIFQIKRMRSLEWCFNELLKDPTYKRCYENRLLRS